MPCGMRPSWRHSHCGLQLGRGSARPIGGMRLYRMAGGNAISAGRAGDSFWAVAELRRRWGMMTQKACIAASRSRRQTIRRENTGAVGMRWSTFLIAGLAALLLSDPSSTAELASAEKTTGIWSTAACGKDGLTLLVNSRHCPDDRRGGAGHPGCGRAGRVGGRLLDSEGERRSA